MIIAGSKCECDLTPGRQAVEEVDVRLAIVLDTNGGRGLAFAVDGHEDGKLFVGVTSDLCGHGVLLCAKGCAFIGSSPESELQGYL